MKKALAKCQIWGEAQASGHVTRTLTPLDAFMLHADESPSQQTRLPSLVTISNIMDIKTSMFSDIFGRTFRTLVKTKMGWGGIALMPSVVLRFLKR